MADEGYELMCGIVDKTDCVVFFELESQLPVVTVASLRIDPATVVHHKTTIAVAAVYPGVFAGFDDLLIAETESQPIQSVDLQQNNRVSFQGHLGTDDRPSHFIVFTPLVQYSVLIDSQFAVLLVCEYLSLASLGKLLVVLHLPLQIINVSLVGRSHSLEIFPDGLKFFVALPLGLEGMSGELRERLLQKSDSVQHFRLTMSIQRYLYGPLLQFFSQKGNFDVALAIGADKLVADLRDKVEQTARRVEVGCQRVFLVCLGSEGLAIGLAGVLCDQVNCEDCIVEGESGCGVRVADVEGPIVPFFGETHNKQIKY